MIYIVTVRYRGQAGPVEVTADDESEVRKVCGEAGLEILSEIRPQSIHHSNGRKYDEQEPQTQDIA